MRGRFICAIVGLILCVFLWIIFTGSAVGDSWAKKKSTAESIWASAAAVVDGKIYVTGGRTPGATPLRTVREYDPVKDEWKTKAEMHIPRFRHCACAVNGRIYVFGGTQDNHGLSVLSSVEEYDPETDTWTEKADMPTPRHSFTVSAVDGRIYAIGGGKGAVSSTWNWVAYKSVEAYDPRTNTWEKKKDMPTSRITHAAGVIDGRIYLFAGMSGDASNTSMPMDVLEYDPALDSWEERVFMQRTRAYVVAAEVNNRIYVIGGIDIFLPAQNLNRYLHDVEEYDAATDTCTKKADMPTGRSDVSIAVVAGRIYVIGGWRGVFLSNVEAYTPEGLHQDGELQQLVSPQGKLISTWSSVKVRCFGR